MEYTQIFRPALDFAASAALAAGFSLLFLGCSSSPAKSDTTSTASGGSSAGNIGGAGNLGGGTSQGPKVVGAFTIDVVPPVAATATTVAVAGHTLVLGRVDTDSQPQIVVWKVSASEGGCNLLVPSIPFCDPSCVLPVVCSGAPAQCRNYPTSVSVGEVTLSGLITAADAGPTSVAIDPIFNQYQLAGVTLAYPPFVENTLVRLDAAGGDVAAFSIEGRAIAPLEITSTSPVTMESGKPLTLTWVAAGSASQSRIRVIVDISHHGGQKGEIDCDVPDAGSMVIPATLVTKLIDLGTAGFPGLQVIRIVSASATIAPGAVQLNIQSSATRSILIPGLVSCNVNEDCPTGQICQTDSTCQ